MAQTDCREKIVLVVLFIASISIYAILCKPVYYLNLCDKIPVFLFNGIDWSEARKGFFLWRWGCFFLLQFLFGVFVVWLFSRFGKICLKEQGFRFPLHKNTMVFWIRATMAFIVTVFSFYFIIINVMSFLKYNVAFRFAPISALDWGNYIEHFIRAPVIEEIFLRGIFCAVLARLIGWKLKTIVLINGAFFAIVHFYYGGADPMNFVGGYFLAWGFCVSRSLVIPTIFHFFGNAVSLIPSIFQSYNYDLINKLIMMSTISNWFG